MSPGYPGPGPAPVAEARGAARRQARRLSAGLAVAFGTTLALALVVAFVTLDYRFGQEPHRLVKILLGGGVGASILLIPRFGLFLLPVASPFLSWMPRIPVPGMSILSLLLFTVFTSWALGRIFARQPIVRRTRLGFLLAATMVLAAISIVRGAAFPTGYHYEGLTAAWELTGRGREVVLLERREVLGGLARPAPLGGQPLEAYYHFICAGVPR